MELSQERIVELEDAVAKEAKWGAWVSFLDTVDSIEELQAVQAHVCQHHSEKDDDLFDFYRTNLTKWSNPELPNGFASRFPLIAKKLDAPYKIRVYLRGCEFCGADPEFLAEVMEPIIRKRDVDGAEFIEVLRGGPDSYRWVDYPRNRACFVKAVLSSYTQIQAWTLSQLLFPDVRSSGTSFRGGWKARIRWDWRTKEERKAAEVS